MCERSYVYVRWIEWLRCIVPTHVRPHWDRTDVIMNMTTMTNEIRCSEGIEGAPRYTTTEMEERAVIRDD